MGWNNKASLKKIIMVYSLKCDVDLMHYNAINPPHNQQVIM
jgi:hypothetical protein